MEYETRPMVKIELRHPCLADRHEVQAMVPMFLRELNGEDPDGEPPDYEPFCLYDLEEADAAGEEADAAGEQNADSAGRATPFRDFNLPWGPNLDGDRPCPGDASGPLEEGEPAASAPEREDIGEDFGGDAWWEHPCSLFPMLITENGVSTGFLLLMAAPFTDRGVDYEAAGIFVLPTHRGRGIGRAAMLAALDRFEGMWKAVPAEATNAFGFWYLFLQERFWEYGPDADGSLFVFENAPSNRKGDRFCRA